MRRAIPVLAAFLLGLPVFAQESQAEPAKVELKLDSKVVAPGGTVKGKVLVTFAPGWHGYQNPPMRDYEIPLKVESKTKGITLKASYPKGQMKDFMGAPTAMYEGTVTIPIVLTMPKTLGTYALKLDVSYQQCDDSSCLPPQTTSVAEKLVVKKPAPKPAKPKKP
jgi:thiol:disulfide interchange protein DsbD